MHSPPVATVVESAVEPAAMRVSSNSAPPALGGAIAKTLRAHGVAYLTCIGARAVNQAVKSIAIARGYLASANLDLSCVPSFAAVVIEGESRTTVNFLVRICEVPA